MTSATTMPDKKEATVIPVIQVEGGKQGRDNKHKTWAIAAVVIALIVVGGITAAVTITLHYTSGQDNITERTVVAKTEDGREVNETITINEDKKTEKTSDKKHDVSVMHDFDKGLTVYRSPDGKGSHYCVLTKLDRSRVQSLDEASAALREKEVDTSKLQLSVYDNTTSGKEGEGDSNVQRSWYQFNDDNIEDRNYIGDEMRELCEGNPMFWGIKSDKPGELEARSKRASGRWRCYVYYVRYVRINGLWYRILYWRCIRL